MSRRDSRKSTLFIAGISARTRARDLAYEFERYGRLVRCDIPAPRNHYSSSKPYAFVEYEDPRDAEDAYFEMQNRRIDGYNIIIQWAKNSPQRSWRFEGGNAPPVQYRRGSADDRRSPRDRRDESPKRYSRDRSPERSQFNGNHSPTGKENGRNSRYN
ncbi:hypothetical protein HK099_007173 [Clydaea vesicula]|uniref:RRM domain-containing protein n=1 Tax=Clydaea vesicula TaxID=447962 RepID=A0AAD5TXI1_9FUNG|nr:hypothetical protein HK099_007173 [Clydaea vesicula]